MRLPPALPFALTLALALVAGLADRALVGQAEANRTAALHRIDEDARLAAQSVESALTQIERAVAAGHLVQGVTTERLAIPPSRAILPGRGTAYAGRSRAELAALLSSTRVTPNGLPEAVVARIILGPEAPLSGAPGALRVEARLLQGLLPVRPEDLPYLASRLGLADDPRVRALAERLRRAPDAVALPAAPTFRRRLTAATQIEGWARVDDRWLQRYELGVDLLLERAGIAQRSALATANAEPKTATADQRRVVAVPEVPGLSLTIRPLLPSGLRLAALRGILWLSAGAGVFGLIGLGRAIAREARAVARERAFLASVTHELRTPLAAIRVLGETLAEGRGEAREYGALVAQEGQRLEALVERVLTLTRLEQVQRLAPVDPVTLLQKVLALSRSRAERRGTSLTLQTPERLPECLWDAEAVERALLNLIDNALLHGRQGGRVEISAERLGSDVRLAVRDDGPGIGRGERGRIFRRFERGHTEAPGTGLGLFLAEAVARAHHGRIDLVTAEGQGSTFTLVLPQRPEPRQPSPETNA